MGHFMDFHSSDFWCPVFIVGGKNGKRIKKGNKNELF